MFDGLNKFIFKSNKHLTRMKTRLLFIIIIILINAPIYSQITNPYLRNHESLNGEWNIIIDPYENGFYNYRYEENPNGFLKNQKPKDKSELIEYDFDKSPTLMVPGDWNTQRENLFFYEGTVWYKKSFDCDIKTDKKYFIYFGAANYETYVYLNGEKLGKHTGGFTPFSFEVTNKLKPKDNFVILKVDNKRKREGIPTLNTDWWNYGGITRDVLLIETPQNYIKDYFIQLKKNSLNEIDGWVKLNEKLKNQNVKIEIPEADISLNIKTNENGFAEFKTSEDLKLWSHENPKLYEVKIKTEFDEITDQIGFRSIKTEKEKIFLNGEEIFLKGISIHEEAPFGKGRANTKEHADTILTWAKELGCNFVRLAHYPHNELMIREAEKMGMLVWSEIPVYWTILWDNKETLSNAENQLTEMITRDKNRAPVIIWSVANETPRGEARMKFLTTLINKAKELDSTRLISAATEVSREKNKIIMDDPLSQHLDVIGVNEYVGWYGGKPGDAAELIWESKFNKPLIISEFGGGSKFGFHLDKETRWSEEYQEDIYINQVVMMKKINFLSGASPWILTDFRSPRRQLPGIQDWYNRKGLISEKGEKKKAFYILQEFYKSIN